MSAAGGAYGIGRLYDEFAARWRLRWADSPYGKLLTASSRTDPQACYARCTAEELRDALREHEAAARPQVP